MKFNNSITPCVLVGLFSLVGSTVFAANWGGGNGNWTDDNWGLSGSYPGETNIVQGLINSAGATVTVDTVLPNAVDFQPRVGTVNIDNGGSITAGAGFAMTMGGSSLGVVNVNIGGTLTMNHSLDHARYGDAEFNVNGGIVNWSGSGGGQIVSFRSDAGAGSGTINVVAGQFNSTSGNGQIRMENTNGTIHVSGGSFNAANATLQMDSSALDNKHSTFKVTGATATAITLKDLRLRTNVGNVNGSATAHFVFGAGSAGVTPIVVGSNLRLDEDGVGASTSSLIVDLSSATPGIGETVLFDYTGGSLAGTFTSVQALGQAGTINYTGGNGTQVTFTSAIPEPSVLALIGLGACVLLNTRRKNFNK